MIDKAKAFDEALERARKMLNMILDNELLGFPDQIREIFPQLKESDDERIRKAIIKSIEEDSSVYEQEVSKEQMLAYLEKQKDQKPVDYNHEMWKNCEANFEGGKKEVIEHPEKYGLQKPAERSEEDKMMLENIISDLRYFKDCETDEEAVSDYEEEIAWLKDIFLNHKKFTEAIDKLWSNEWNEEDEKDIAHIIEILDDCYASGRHDLSKTNHENLVNKLKSLHPIKQEWTEEDEEIWFALVTFFKGYLQKYPPLCKDEKVQANRILKWLNTTIKSFRLHYRWKPSKEKMDALKNVAYGTYQNGDGPALRELYEQLLKLGVKEEPEYCNILPRLIVN